MAIVPSIVDGKTRVAYHSSHSISGKIQRVQPPRRDLKRGAGPHALDFPNYEF